MAETKRIPADRLLFATISVMRTLIGELSRKGLIDPDEFVQVVQQTAVAHREAGEPKNLGSLPSWNTAPWLMKMWNSP